MKKFQVRLADGKLLSGATAFVAVGMSCRVGNG
jgi:hypothetical protein